MPAGLIAWILGEWVVATPLKILVSWVDYYQYTEKKKKIQTTNQENKNPREMFSEPERIVMYSWNSRELCFGHGKKKHYPLVKYHSY